MDFVKAGGIDHYIQRLYIHWDITTMCQHKCSYCYARKQYGSRWGTLGNWDIQKYVVDEISKSSLPVFLGLLGGEPTLHQRYFQLVDLIQERALTHEMSRLYITTNGARSSDFFDKHKDNDGRTYILWSLHPEHVDFDSFVSNIGLMHGKGYKTKVNLMLHQDPKYWHSLKEWYAVLNGLDYAIIHPHFVYDGFSADVEYNKEFYDFFGFLEGQRTKEFVMTGTDGDAVFCDYEIFRNGYNRFFGWNCWHNNYEISVDGIVSDQCFDQRGRFLPENFFKDIKEISPRVCRHPHCSCDGLMKIYKEK